MNNLFTNLGTGFVNEPLPECIHICLIYDQDEERDRIVAEYMATGIQQGQQVRYLADKTSPETVRSWLTEMGVNVPEAMEKGLLSIARAEDAYCPSGYFSPPEYIEAMPARFSRSKAAGYQGMRSCGEMTWSMKGLPGSNRLMEYEVLLNTVHADYPFSGMCQYDARLFDGATLYNVLKVHPWMIVRGKVIQNPYYISPREFLKESGSNR
ncbi:MAG TPA: MEDS domain-containing protein [Anaerolineales bacterium]|nr:MEDS domain-containing protein [Anaerolineales bacterium]